MAGQQIVFKTAGIDSHADGDMSGNGGCRNPAQGVPATDVPRIDSNAGCPCFDGGHGQVRAEMDVGYDWQGTLSADSGEWGQSASGRDGDAGTPPHAPG